ncbi:hypothetical protein [Novosphingobium sp. FSW06-99]|uniref:hypothetical protein n=1 Tax=Novosphingobium sp. FSW06-99 TaxID=1739113 RepID=UPI00076C23FD|nr:hypothetical protein [Novosphingobium sp. FSW06-99]KUR80900.1 hypothetical protein AQZ49_02435 [Novosphingobium sp. FSW06-99]
MAGVTTETARPTPWSERTIAGLALAFNVNLIIFALFLVWRKWPDAVAPSIIWYLGGVLIIMALGNLLIIGGMMSPWIGTIRVSGMGMDLDVNGGADAGAN